MIMSTLRRWICCLAFLLTLALGAGTAAALKICVSVGLCTQCDFLDSNGNVVGSIYWCKYS